MTMDEDTEKPKTAHEISASIRVAGEKISNPAEVIKDRDAPGVAEVVPANEINKTAVPIPTEKTEPELGKDPKEAVDPDIVKEMAPEKK